MKILEAVQKILFATTGITDIVGQRIFYDNGPVGTEWPLVHWFDVSHQTGYKMDYSSCIIQFSAWALDRFIPVTLLDLFINTFNRYNGTVTLAGVDRTLKINWSTLNDAGELPTDSVGLYGRYARIEFKYSGDNLEG